MSEFERIAAAYRRGAEWQWQNAVAGTIGVVPGVEKAAYDYADRTLGQTRKPSQLRVTGFRGNPTRVVLSDGHEATITQKLIDAFATPSPFHQPIAQIEFARGVAGRENEMPRVVSCDWLSDGTYAVFLHPTPTPVDQTAGWTKVPEEPTLEFLKSINSDNQVLSYENGRYYNAWFEFEQSEGAWFWTDDADSEPNPSHYRPLGPIALASSEGRNDG